MNYEYLIFINYKNLQRYKLHIDSHDSLYEKHLFVSD